jgi:zinc protease
MLVASGLAQQTGASRNAADQDESWRKNPPRSGLAESFKLPASREIRLDNGLTLVVIEDHRSPIVTIQAGVPVATSSYGVSDTLMNQAALAEATADLLTEGAGARTSEQLAREVESLGGRISSSINDDYLEVIAAVVAENAERMIDIIGDVLVRPTFPRSEVALYKSNRIENLKVQRQDPAFLASERFNRAVYGSHYYGISAPTTESVKAINRARVIEFYKAHFGPTASVVIVTGDFDTAKIEAKVRAALGRWQPRKRATKGGSTGRFPAQATRRIYLIDRAGSEQADIRIGGLAVEHSHEDYFPLVVANAVLGAGTGSRLFLNIRERKGYAYDVYSTVSALKQAGTFYIASETRTGVTTSAIKETLAEVARLRNERVGPEELQNAKNYIAGLFSILLSTQGGIAEQMTLSRLLGLGPGYIEHYREHVERVTAADVERVARKYLSSETAVIVVVGDATKLRKELSGLGAVEVFNPQGRRIR